jgi:hypothetical protein
MSTSGKFSLYTTEDVKFICTIRESGENFLAEHDCANWKIKHNMVLKSYERTREI